ncbi:beta-ketoacyl synthase N-terminal-like domain-containing protein [Streptomyces sp. NPDC004609]|uniref:beta-ketoacyl synthase N-terminal-like domain-containing protein n=1 Tax=Streptomyces sp. NPDC004609 TaxID=3364704 RepID=UPI0036C3F213
MSVVVTGVGLAVRGAGRAADLLGPLPGCRSGFPDPVSRLTGRGLRYKDRATKLAMAAARDALTEAGLVDADGEPAVPGRTVGVVASTNYGNADTVCDTVRTIADHTYLGTSPMMLPATSSNVTASWVAITHGLRGANLTLCNGPTSGVDAVHWARLLIAAGRVDRVLVVGTEPDNPAVRHITGHGARPDRAGSTRPAGRGRPGGNAVTGGSTDSAEAAAEAAVDAAGDRGAPEAPGPFDGAAALVVESAASAGARGARTLAAIGPYARRGEHATAVTAVRRRLPGRVGLWCVPEHRDGVPAPAPSLGAVADNPLVHDLSALLGPASGALGILQCVAATAWLERRPDPGQVLVSAGAGAAGGDDASAALLLTAGLPGEAGDGRTGGADGGVR